MLIDWFTVVAQIVNFVVLVVLLKHFLYDRIIGAMARREETIRARREAAENEKEEAQQEADAYRKKKEEIEEKRNEMHSQAKQAAEEELGASLSLADDLVITEENNPFRTVAVLAENINPLL